MTLSYYKDFINIEFNVNVLVKKIIQLSDAENIIY